MEELKRLTGGMNQDLDPDYIPEGDYVEAWNCIGHRDVNTYGRLFNLLGTEKNAYVYSGAYVETVLGVAFDRPNNTVYYLVYNTAPANFILQFNLTTKVTKIVCDHINLGFHVDYPIQAIVESGVLIWTDMNTGPKRLEIQRAINTTYVLGSPDYPAWTTQTFHCIWYPPNERPIVAYGSDLTRKTNNVRKKVFQFAYRYKYYDKGRSVFGPYSEILIPAGEEKADGQYNDDATLNNKITIQCHEGVTGLVDEVELFVRELRTDSAIGYWRLTKTFVVGVDTPVGDYFVFDFINDRSQQIDINEALRPYDYIPRKAKTVTTVRDSQVVFGNYVEDYDNVVPDVTLSHKHYKQTNVIGNGYSFEVIQYEEDFEVGRIPVELEPEYVVIHVGDIAVRTGEPYILTYAGNVYTYTPTGGDTTDTVAAALAALVGISPVYVEYGDDLVFMGMNKIGHDITLSVNVAVTATSVEKVRTWKKGALIPLGLLYRDAQGRPVGGVVQNSSTRYKIPFSTEESPLLDSLSAAITTPDYYTQIEFSIAHLPPQLAATWQWVYLKNNLLSYETYKVKKVTTIIESALKRRIGFDVNSFIFANDAVSYKSLLSPYEFTEGDRLRIITKDSSTLLTDYLDFAIHGVYDEVDANENTTQYVLVDNFDYPSYDIEDGCTVEIYRPDYEVFPAEDEETISDYDEQWRVHFYEIGDVYDIYDSGGTKYHRGPTQDQTAVLPATGVINSGDAIQRTRHYLNDSFFAECSSISDYYDSAYKDQGRLALSLPNIAEKTYENGLRYGGQNQSLHDDTNYMFSFDYDGFSLEIPKEHGPIYKILTLGDILKVFQATKVSSVYIGRDAAITADGGEILRTTDKVLGSIRPSEDNHGTVFPTSVLSDGTNIYFFDLYKKAFVANTPSGNVVLSEFGMQKFFLETCNTLINRTFSGIKAFTCIDKYGYVILTLKDATVDSTINWGLVFDKDLKKWKGFLSNPGDYVTGWDRYISFVEGDLYLHNEDTVNLGLILGTQVTQSIKISSTALPGQEKTFKTILLETNHNMRLENKTYSLPADQALLDVMWASATKGDVMILPTANDVNGRQTRLLPLRWKRVRNELYCTIPPDMYDPEAIIRSTIIASGAIANGTLYHVDGGSVVYDGETYVNGDEFTGTAVTTYSGTGRVRTVASIEELSIREGREMKGTTLFVTIRNQATTEVWIKSISINFINK